MDKQQTLKAACRTLGLIHTRDTLEMILHEAEKECLSYLDFLVSVTDGEILYKQEKAKNKRIKEAGFPYPEYSVLKKLPIRKRILTNRRLIPSFLPRYRLAYRPS